MTGTMSAFVGFGAPFRGPFGRVDAVTSDGLTVAPLMARLSDPVPSEGSTAVPAAAAAEVIADLRGPGAQMLSCSFHLNDPKRGMRGGGWGECLLDGVSAVQAAFPAPVPTSTSQVAGVTTRGTSGNAPLAGAADHEIIRGAIGNADSLQPLEQESP